MEKRKHHHHHHAHSINGKNLLITIFLNVFITIAQIAGGFISGSLSLLSDALHNFSDVMALVISWIANKMGHLPANDKRTFGYKRAEIISALINAIALLFIAFFLIKTAIERFGHPVMISSNIVIWMAGLSIVLNGISVLIVAKDAKKSINMKSAYLHLFSDMISSIAVMLGGIAIHIWNITWLDSILSVIIAVYLIISSWKLVLETLKILMQFSPDGFEMEKVSEEIRQMCEVENVHHIHVWKLNDHQVHFEAHIDFKNNLPLDEVDMVLGKIRETLKRKFGITHTTLQPEYRIDDQKDLIIQ